MFEHVLVAVDGSPTGNRGLKAAIGLASAARAALTVLHVVDGAQSVAYIGDMGYVPPDYVDNVVDDLRKRGRAILAKAEEAARAGGVAAGAMLVETRGGSIADAILTHARKARVDTIVLGTHGRRGLARALMGSDAETVLRDARVPVLLVRALPRSAGAGSNANAPAAPAKPRAARRSA